MCGLYKKHTALTLVLNDIHLQNKVAHLKRTAKAIEVVMADLMFVFHLKQSKYIMSRKQINTFL